MKTILTICIGLIFLSTPVFAQTNNTTATPEIEKTKTDTASKPLMLKPKKNNPFTGTKTKKTIPGSPESMAYTFGVLAILILGILICAKLVKRKNPSLGKSLPSEAFEVLGRKSLNVRQSIMLFRCGSKILVVGATEDGLNTLTEITDPVEVDFLSGLCRSEETSGNASEMFRSLFSKSISPNKPQQQTQRPTQNRNENQHLNQVTEQLDRAVRQQQLNQMRTDQSRSSTQRETRRA